MAPPDSAAALALMPDIAGEALEQPDGALSWVGMDRIHLPISLQPGQSVLATVDAYVDLTDPTAKGIHMSRLPAAARPRSSAPDHPDEHESAAQRHAQHAQRHQR